MIFDRENNKDINEPKNNYDFFERIGHPELNKELTPSSPWAYFTIEFYGEGIMGSGGLGILAADTFEAIKKLNIPFVFITPFYPLQRKRVLKNFIQDTEFVDISPQKQGFKKIDNLNIEIQTLIDGKVVPTSFDVFQKEFNKVRLLTFSEPNFGYLYQDENNSDHRLYQEVALGFGGAQILEKLNINPRVLQINESAAVFGALYFLDKFMSQTNDFNRAIEKVKKITIYTNHTLVPAAEPVFSLDQFKRFVFPNISSSEVKDWLMSLFQNGFIRLSQIAIELSSKRNGVSIRHSQEASRFYYLDGKPVEFSPVTNGISIERWIDPKLFDYYKENGILDDFGELASDFVSKIDNLDKQRLLKLKDENRQRLRETLKKYNNQYGEPINIPSESLIFVWKRRITAYKRPELVFGNVDMLAEILEKNNAYFIMTGEVHPKDEYMKNQLSKILKLIDENPILRRRVYFISNYNPEIAKALSLGADISLNTPTVRNEKGEKISTEACGTSWAKDILGNTILISVSDGGVADWEILHPTDDNKPFLEISGTNQNEELNSLYENMKKAVSICESKDGWSDHIKRQLKAYFPIISDTRMIRDYLNFYFYN